MTVTILKGDCREVLRTLPAESVHAVVTSPPYWGLRDYGTAQWSGGDLACDHRESSPSRTEASIASSGLDGGKASVHLSHQFKGDCLRCGAVRIDSQIGLEASYGDYVDAVVSVFREVRRVLNGDGTVWLNLGDSYATGAGKVGARPGGGEQGDRWAGTPALGNSSQLGDRKLAGIGPMTQANRMPQIGLKPKDLAGIPWRVAFALQADGWWLRQDIIWSKPNPMPESVTDRCTKAHEYMFLLSKSERYYFDQEAIAEPAVKAGLVLHSYGTAAKDRQDVSETNDRRTRIGLANWNQGQPDTRNKRSVWEVTTQPFPEAHFATFPPALIEPCILAGCPNGGTVLDPFGGAGTTGLVADRLGRNAILIELNPEYAAMAERRIKADAGMFAEVQS